MRLSKKLVIAALGSATLVLNPLAALAAGPTIEDTDGPLVRIAISDTLNCSINYKGDKYNEFYNGSSTTAPADCGTFLAVGSELFGPQKLTSISARNTKAIAYIGRNTLLYCAYRASLIGVSLRRDGVLAHPVLLSWFSKGGE